MDPILHSIFVGQPQTMCDDRGTWTSSICRDRVEGPVQVLTQGLRGDQVTQPYHGGPDSAVCGHLCDHYEFWNSRFELNLLPGQMGENFTLDGIREEQICVGDIVCVGAALLQVSGPRVPCANLARRIGRADWVRLTIRENRTGFYMRVLKPGMVMAGDRWELLERKNDDASISAVNRCSYLTFDRNFAARLVHMSGLGEWWKQQFLEKLQERGEHWTAKMGQ